MISAALCDRIRQAAVEARLSVHVCRCIDRDLIAEDWSALAVTLDAASQSRRGTPLSELAAELRAALRAVAPGEPPSDHLGLLRDPEEPVTIEERATLARIRERLIENRNARAS